VFEEGGFFWWFALFCICSVRVYIPMFVSFELVDRSTSCLAVRPSIAIISPSIYEAVYFIHPC